MSCTQRTIGRCVLAMLVAMPIAVHGALPATPPAAQDSPRDRGRAPAVPAAAILDEYTIGPEDVLEILAWRNVELSRTVQVRPDGKISLPLVNDVQAAGLTPMQLRQALAQGYAKYFTEPEISVSVREVHSIKVSVLGLVRTPGRYELKSEATVLEALAMAGGFTEFAKRDKVFLSRLNGAERKRIPFNYQKLLDGDDQENIVLRRGDIIIVP